MTKFALGIQYDGTNFHGWQRQAGVTQTVQGVLEEALSRVADHPVTLTAAGRTDRGVHATGQVAAFDTTAEREPHAWRRGVNSLTPVGIQVTWVQETNAEFHPRYRAIARRYLYVFSDREHDPFAGPFTWAVPGLDADRMHREAQALLGEHDFSAFRAAGCQSLTPLRRVNHVSVRRVGAFTVLDIEANAFLLHMVRNIARGIADVGVGSSTRSIDAMLQSRDRNLLGATAPPNGLYLYRVGYADYSFPAPMAPSILQASDAHW